MRKFAPITLLSIISCLYISCNTSYQANSLQYHDYRITPSQPRDTVMGSVMKPYSDSVNKSMNDILGIADITLEKKSPEGTLGNFMVDAFYTMAREKHNMAVDVAFINYGGIRLTQLPAGNVTRGKIFEMMPFDNILVLQRLKGRELQQFLDLIAARGGWPVAGMSMQIKDKKAINVLVAGKPIDPDAVYGVLNSDFVANGGDNADILKVLPRETRGYLMRDAIIDYIQKLKSQGKNISARVENRVTNVE